MQHTPAHSPFEIPARHLEQVATMAAATPTPSQVDAFHATTRLAKGDLDGGPAAVLADLATVYAFTLPPLTPQKVAKSDFAWVAQAAGDDPQRPEIAHTWYDATKNLAVATNGKVLFRSRVDLGDVSGYYNRARVRLDWPHKFPNWPALVTKHTKVCKVSTRDCKPIPEATLSKYSVEFPMVTISRAREKWWIRRQFIAMVFGHDTIEKKIPLHYTPGNNHAPIEFRPTPERRAVVMPIKPLED